MRLLRKIVPKYVPLLMVVCAVVAAYSGIFRLFYTQDEWMGVGDVIGYGATRFMWKYSIDDILFGKGRILGAIFNFLFYRYFTFNTVPFALFSLFFHSVNSILLYLISERITGKRLGGIVGGMFYALAAVHTEAVWWFGANTTALPSATFVFLSVYLLLRSVQNREPSLLIWSQVSAVVAFLYKDSAIFLAAYLPFLYWLYSAKTDIRGIAGKFWPIGAYFAVAFGKVAWVLLHLSPDKKVSVFVTNSVYAKYKVLFHAVMYPVLSLSQIFVPQQYMFKLASLFQKANYEFLDPNPMAMSISENVTADLMSMFFSAFAMLGIVFMVRWDKKNSKAYWAGTALAMLSFLPFVFVDRGGSFLDSRYFIIGTAGGGILLGLLVSFLWDRMKNFRIPLKVTCGAAIAILLCGYLYSNARLVRRQIMVQAYVSEERRNFLGQLKALHPVLPKDVIVYATGDALGFYGLPYVKIPLQQGAGYTFMAYYYGTGTIPVEFIRDEFLWNIKEQDYRRSGDRGFGYFFDKQMLKEYLMEHPGIPIDRIIGLYYRSADHVLQDYTPQIHKYLSE